MEFREAQKHQEQTQQWAGCDPFTLVSAAKQTLYKEVAPQAGGNSSETLGPLEEIISRFEQQTRASLGTGVSSVSGPVTAGRS